MPSAKDTKIIKTLSLSSRKLHSRKRETTFKQVSLLKCYMVHKKRRKWGGKGDTSQRKQVFFWEAVTFEPHLAILEIPFSTHIGSNIFQAMESLWMQAWRSSCRLDTGVLEWGVISFKFRYSFILLEKVLM